MSESRFEGWCHARIRHKPSRTQLHIFHRPGDERYVEALIAYRETRLSGLEEIRSSAFAEVHRGKLYDHGPVCYLKRFLIRGWRDRCKHILFPSRARRALIAGLRIESLGFHTPAPVCLLEARRAGFVRESVLVTKEIPNATHVFGWLNWPELGVAGRPDRKRELICAFGREAGKWHAAQLYHGDMRLGNIIATLSPGGFTMYWLDNERTRRFRVLPHRLRVQNLVQTNMNRLGVTAADRLRFWKAYLETCPLPPQTQQRVLRDVNRQTQARLKKYIRP